MDPLYMDSLFTAHRRKSQALLESVATLAPHCLPEGRVAVQVSTQAERRVETRFTACIKRVQHA